MWCFGITSSKPIEAAGFIIMALAVVARLSQTSVRGLYGSLLRSPVLWCLLAWAALVSASTLWHGTSGPPQRLGWLPDRDILVPFLLWPLVHRWRVLLGALVLGALAQSAMLVAATVSARQAGTMLTPATLPSRFGAYQLALAIGVLAAAPLLVPRLFSWAGIASSIALLILATGELLQTQRGGVFGSVMGLLVVSVAAIRARPQRALARLAPLIVILAALGATAVYVDLTSPVVERLETKSSGFWPLTDGKAIEYRSINTFTGSRLALTDAACSLIMQAPLFGHGEGDWGPSMKAWAEANPESPALKTSGNALTGAGSCHNTLLHAAFVGGIPAAIALGLTVPLALFALVRSRATRSMGGIAVAGGLVATATVGLTIVATSLSSVSMGLMLMLTLAMAMSSPTREAGELP